MATQSVHKVREPDTCARNWPQDEQPHYAVLKCPDACSDAQVLAVLIRSSGTKEKSSIDLAREMMAANGGSLTGALQAARDQHTEQAARLVAAVEIVTRALKEKLTLGGALNSPSAVREFLRLKLQSLPHEVFVCLFLDAQNRVIEIEELFRGTLTQTSVYPREVVKRALHHNCGAVIFAHNHPSGIAEPSHADETLTQALKQALALIDVRVLDHFIVAGSGVLSFAERGLL
jgi:DNA repair protein RadC